MWSMSTSNLIAQQTEQEAPCEGDDAEVEEVGLASAGNGTVEMRQSQMEHQGCDYGCDLVICKVAPKFAPNMIIYYEFSNPLLLLLSGTMSVATCNQTLTLLTPGPVRTNSTQLASSSKDQQVHGMIKAQTKSTLRTTADLDGLSFFSCLLALTLNFLRLFDPQDREVEPLTLTARICWLKGPCPISCILPTAGSNHSSHMTPSRGGGLIAT